MRQYYVIAMVGSSFMRSKIDPAVTEKLGNKAYISLLAFSIYMQQEHDTTHQHLPIYTCSASSTCGEYCAVL